MVAVLSALALTAALAADRPEIGAPRPYPWDEPARTVELPALPAPRPRPRVLPAAEDLRTAERRARLLAASAARAKSLSDEEAAAAWAEALDHLMALRSLGEAIRPLSRALSARFLKSWAAAFARRPAARKAFDRAFPELGLPAGTWTALRAGGSLPPTASRAGSWSGPAEEAPAARLRTALRALLPGPAPEPRARPPVLVSRAQIRELSVRLEPGDMLLVRRERFLGEDGAGGFWERACLYIGGWRASCPGGTEAVGLVRAAAADHLAVLRPRPGAPLGVTANEAARLFDRFFGTERQPYDLVAYLAGDEGARRAVPAGVEDFRRSWRRPRWTPAAGANGRKEG